MDRAILEQMVQDLENVQGVKSVKVGIESNQTANDYPMIRIVVDSLERIDTFHDLRAEVSIYFAEPIHEFDDGLIGIYGSQLEMNDAIITILEGPTQGYTAQWISTEFDSDQFKAYKVAVSTFTVTTFCGN